MSFQAGDKVVHGVYGPGEVLKLDQKVIAGRPGDYYVVQVGDMTIWVPEDNGGKSSLRPPTPADEFERLFSILSSPGEPLLEDRYERKTQLQEKMRDGTLESI